MQSICPDATCFLSKPCNRLWDLQSVFDHTVFAALDLDNMALDWSLGIAVALKALLGLGFPTSRRCLNFFVRTCFSPELGRDLVMKHPLQPLCPDLRAGIYQ